MSANFQCRQRILFPLIIQSAVSVTGYRGFHELLPPGSSSIFFETNLFKNKIQNERITRLLFLRHGKTAPSPDGIDYNRKLTEEGRIQSSDSGRIFGCTLLPFYKNVLISPSPRTTETANLFLTASFDSDHAQTQRNCFLTPIQEAYDGTMQPEGSAIFKKIGYAPLIHYLDNKQNEHDKNTARQLLGQYASNIMASIISVIDSNERQERRLLNSSNYTMVFVGHAIYLPAVVFGIACTLDCDDGSKELILNTVTGEAEGYLVDVTRRQVTYLSRQAPQQ